MDGSPKPLVLEAAEVGAMDARRVGVQDLVGQRTQVCTKVHGAFDHEQPAVGGINTCDLEHLGVQALSATGGDDNLHPVHDQSRRRTQTIGNSLKHGAAVEEIAVTQGPNQ